MAARASSIARVACDQMAMGLISISLALLVVVAEVIRVCLYPVVSTHWWCRGRVSPSHLIVFFDGDCAVCSSLRSLVVYRTKEFGSRVTFVPAQTCAVDEAQGCDAAVSAARRALEAQGISVESLLERMHVVESRATSVAEEGTTARVHAGASAILRLFRELHEPYPTLSVLASYAPEALVDGAYEVFARHRASRRLFCWDVPGRRAARPRVDERAPSDPRARP